MNTQSVSLDDMPINRFHIRMTVLTFGAHFTDGYAMGSIALALAMIGPAFEINAVWQGLLGSSALIGIFTGSLIIGRISDKVGRQKYFSTVFSLSPLRLSCNSLCMMLHNCSCCGF